MPATHADSDAYLEAFMNGFEFVLLAIRGRLAESNLPASERARLESFLADYSRITRAYHARRAAAEPEALAVHGVVPVEVAPTMRN